MLGYTVKHFESIDSTNAYALENWVGLEHHQIILSKIQTRGRGRWERDWVSTHTGNLYMTLLEKELPKRCLVGLHNFTQLMALAVVRSCFDCGAKVGIKWPNDIVYGGAKLAGILSQSRFAGGEFRVLAVGLGFNLAWAPELPHESSYKAVCLAKICLSAVPTREEFLEFLMRNYLDLHAMFISKGFSSIAQEYRQNIVHRDGKFRVKGESDSYSYAGIGRGGELLGKAGDGSVRAIIGGEVRWI